MTHRPRGEPEPHEVNGCHRTNGHGRPRFEAAASVTWQDVQHLLEEFGNPHLWRWYPFMRLTPSELKHVRQMLNLFLKSEYPWQFEKATAERR